MTLSPTYQVIRERVRHGDVGKVCLARARYGWAGPDWSNWFYRAGGGPIFDLAVYSITSLTGILGPAKRVMAMTASAQPSRVVNGKKVKVEVEDNVQIILDFGDAVLAVVTSGFTMQKYRSPAFELYGTQGTIQMLGDDWTPEGYEIWRTTFPLGKPTMRRIHTGSGPQACRTWSNAFERSKSLRSPQSTRTMCWKSCWPRKRPVALEEP